MVLKDLKLKAEALNSLQLPVTVKAGLIGTITLKVPNLMSRIKNGRKLVNIRFFNGI